MSHRSSIDHRPAAFNHLGLLNIAKPAGLTSRKIVSRVQRMVRPAKAGHAGTLDPLATGVLLVCIGRATRLVPLIHELYKVYRATFLLGRTSQTDDIDGTVVAHPHAPRPERDEILAALPEFVGRIKQRPPAYSAIRVGGRRAYRLARQGQDVELAPRTVDVFRIDLLRYESPEVVLEIECGTGTYVRSIGRDLGERIGCGAVLSALERTAIGPFKVEAAVPIDQLCRASLPQHLLPATAALSYPQVVVDEAAVRELTLGRSAPLGSRAAAGRSGDRPQPGRSGDRPQPIVVLDEKGALVALADVEGDQLAPRQVFAERT